MTTSKLTVYKLNNHQYINALFSTVQRQLHEQVRLITEASHSPVFTATHNQWRIKGGGLAPAPLSTDHNFL